MKPQGDIEVWYNSPTLLNPSALVVSPFTTTKPQVGLETYEPWKGRVF